MRQTITLHGLFWSLFVGTVGASESVLEGTKPLTWTGDIASRLIEGADRFLLRQLELSRERRSEYWRRDFSSASAYAHSLEPNRRRLAHILGLRDIRIPFRALELVQTTEDTAQLAESANVEIFQVRWPAFGDVYGEGLLLRPKGRRASASVIAIPDATQDPEHLAGLDPEIARERQFAVRLAESGCQVVVPLLINRAERQPTLSNREYLYRSAFELGRHLIGYELQKVLALVDLFSEQEPHPIGVVGWAEGGMLALYAGAVDERIDAVMCSGHFGDRRILWQQPIDRNLFGLLEQFGDAELASMIAPRALIVEAARGPDLQIPGGRGAPAELVTPELAEVETEFARARQLVGPLVPTPPWKIIESGNGRGGFGSVPALAAFLKALQDDMKLAPLAPGPNYTRTAVNSNQRHARQFHQLDRHNQSVLRESAYTRDKFMQCIDPRSLATYDQSVRPYREFFYDEVIGRFDLQFLDANPRSRLTYETDKWIGYEVVLDVFPDVIAYGLLLLPRDIREGEKRPVVVCQHGLEGRPQFLIGEEGYGAYKAFAAQLAEQGFITFAPQNLYIFGDRFRTLQRKANPLKKTLFSIIVPQHQQIVDWLQALPFVDAERIAFYGLSYGGKTAMRVPPLVEDYCLSICSADFNEWVDKNASTRNPHSYVNTGEYEIFEFDLGSTFNYSEMAHLIAPRPFMVERGHYDGVASDETVAYEFAKVRFLYAAKLGIPDRCEIEWFNGPHTINGQGTFDFLRRHLGWKHK